MRPILTVLLSLTCLLPLSLALAAAPAEAAGARLYKSGPIQITADGSAVWLVNPDNDSVTRILTATEAVLEVPLPDPGTSHSPRGLAVADDGSEAWVACHDSDRVYVLDGTTGAELARIDLPWGTGPWSVVLAPPTGSPPAQSHAWVTGFRGASLVQLDVAARSVAKVIEPGYHSPLGLTFTGDGSAWVTHLFADGEHPRLVRLDLSDPGDPKVSTKIRVFPAQPQRSSSTAPRRAEGGYLTLRGHPAQVPAGQDQGRLWLPVQYTNIHEDLPHPDSTIQSSLRKVDLGERRIADGGNFPPNPDHPAKVILTAVDVHDPSSPSVIYDGPGWDAQVSGPVDLAFSADGTTAWVLHEQSEDVVVVPTNTPPVAPGGAPPLVEIGVGQRPMGIVASPVGDLAYVANVLSRDVSVLDLAAGVELRRIAATPVTGAPFTATVQLGAELFHSSNRDEISQNRKLACASCHLNGEHDGRVWELQHLPGNHGPRATQTMAGVAATYGPVDPATGWGQLHRSGDRDEVQDFEHTLQGPQMGGLGFLGGAVHPELGTPNAGRDPNLDALAAYVFSLPAPPRSPFREAGGTLSPAAVRGATFFMGSDLAKPADAVCATCHVPQAGFVDHAFHDVGQLEIPGENELNLRTPADHVNTAGLAGLWATPPYEGVTGYDTLTVPHVLRDFRDRPGSDPPHGRVGGLTGRQLRDLATFLLSLDGNTTAAEVAAAQDTAPPAIVRVAATSPTRVEVWLDESVEQGSAENPATWGLADVAAAQAVNVISATLDPQSQDRVTLVTAPLTLGCQARDFELRVAGSLSDLAGTVSGGTANVLTAGPPLAFAVDDEITVTLGASGTENLTVPVHEAATLPGLTTWSHGSPWLQPDPSNPSTGFVRFEWVADFQSATGVSDSSDVVHAAITLAPDLGDAQAIEARRVLLPWYDHRGPDFNSNPVDPGSGHGGPTWLQAEHGVRDWNVPNARATSPGVDGDQPGDYGGAFDTAHTPDATVTLSAIDRPFTLAGPAVTDAFRFWFDNPSLDHGYALRLLPGTVHDVRFEASEPGFHDGAPVLEIAYRVAGACNPQIFTDGFETGDTSAWQ